MRNESTAGLMNRPFAAPWSNLTPDISRRVLIGAILIIALFAFELFNFDTTRYALDNLLGDVRFAGLRWAGILAVAFCSIDFAGLTRLFTPERSGDESRGSWYLMGAWLLGATMNALMTWWAVSLTLLNHDFGNEVLSREQLLTFVPVFVAAMVWLTRILFIGAFTVAGNHLWKGVEDQLGRANTPTRAPLRQSVPVRENPATARAVRNSQPGNGRQPVRERTQAAGKRSTHSSKQSADTRADAARTTSRSSRSRQRPPLPGTGIRRIPLEFEGATSNGKHR